MKRKLDIVILSDTHLGTYGCHAKELLHYLQSIEIGTLVLNGDFIDMWNVKKGYFPKEHIAVLQYILELSAQGTKVYYITGNHDDILRSYSNFSSGNIHLLDKLILQINGKRYWIFHGDVFDLFRKHSPIVARLGGKGYDYLIKINHFINQVRAKFGKPRRSFAQKVKARVKEAVQLVNDFENTAIQLAGEQGYDYVICGHIHRPQIRVAQVGEQTVTYMNSGDWVENLTALEFNWGKWTLYEYDETEFEPISRHLKVKEKVAAPARNLSQAALLEELLSVPLEGVLRGK